MPEAKKPLNIWEREQFIVINNIDDDPKESEKVMTADEFKDLADENGWVGVNVPERVEFLEANGYEVTRANLVDSSLSAQEA